MDGADPQQFDAGVVCAEEERICILEYTVSNSNRWQWLVLHRARYPGDCQYACGESREQVRTQSSQSGIRDDIVRRRVIQIATETVFTTQVANAGSSHVWRGLAGVHEAALADQDRTRAFNRRIAIDSESTLPLTLCTTSNNHRRFGVSSLTSCHASFPCSEQVLTGPALSLPPQSEHASYFCPRCALSLTAALCPIIISFVTHLPLWYSVPCAFL